MAMVNVIPAVVNDLAPVVIGEWKNIDIRG